ncbi:MAG: cobyrinate a,c-diamide synthase [Thermoleophilia bacterium]|nr:cobyrinate a,c-diamide synthase [Thermoleophilia bacterium]
MIPLMIAGAASGVGKTTIAIGVMGALGRRGLSVAPFKTGPDYIDPSYHLAVTGNPSRNLDTWLTSPEVAVEIFNRGSSGTDAAVIEGAMGLFDGRSGAGDQCSSAEIARLTDSAVLLVVDCSRMARSLAPLLAGYAAFDPRVHMAGTILNNVGSASHGRVLEDAAREAGVPVLGVVPRRPDLGLSSRHLGLVPAGERAGSSGGDQEETLEDVLEHIVDHIEENIDVEALLQLRLVPGGVSGSGADMPVAAGESAAPASGSVAVHRARLAVALDEAFSFYYIDSLEALAAAGAELVYFSPMRDEALPACDGLYLGGGYPEVHARELEANSSMRASVAAAVSDGLPTYAECGGLVYLCESVEVDGARHSMSGVLPMNARMTAHRQALGYVEAEARRGSLLLGPGERVRGHEFHWSVVEWREDRLAYDCFSSREPGPRPDGYAGGNLLATYVHLHFAGNTAAASRFIDACAGVGEVAANATA